MTYTRTFSQKKYAEIEDILEKLVDLEPGNRITVSGLDKITLSRARSLLYDWFWHMGNKEKFIIRVISGDLTILRRGLGHFSIQKDAPLQGRLDNILREMINSENENVAYKIAKDCLGRAQITPEEMGVLISKYVEVMG